MNEEVAKQQKNEEAKEITLQEVFDKYIEIHKQETSGKTWKVTQGYYRTWIEKPLGNRALDGISVDTIYRML